MAKNPGGEFLLTSTVYIEIIEFHMGSSESIAFFHYSKLRALIGYIMINLRAVDLYTVDGKKKSPQEDFWP